MSSLSIKTLIICLVILLPMTLHAQDQMTLLDSVSIAKPKKAGNRFVINHASLREITFSRNNPVRYPFPGGRKLSDSANYTGPSFGDGFFGIQTARAKTFLLRGELDCSNPGLNWTIALYSEGLLERTWNSEKQEDGSFSVKTDKTIVLYWDKGAGGMIVEQADTIGRFYIVMNPRTDAWLQQFAGEVYDNEVCPVKSASRNTYYLNSITRPSIEYGIYGKIRGRKFALLTNGITYQSYIYIDSKLSCIFQSDIDFKPTLKKKDRIMPYILYNNAEPVILQNDLFRLAILSRLLTGVLCGSVY